MSRRVISIGLVSFVTAGFVAVSPLAATAGSSGGMGLANTTGAIAVAPPSASAQAGTVAPQSTHAYPSATSTIVGSVGFIDANQVGYFWSASRGDSVTESFAGPNRVKKAILKLDVVSNALVSGAHVDWTVSINGTDVGSFQVVSGQLGPVTHRFTFPRITGGTYLVKMRVTNEVAGGEGSHTLRYAGAGQHELKLRRR